MAERTESKGSGASVTSSVLGGTSALFGALRARVGDEDSLRRFGHKITRSYKVVALLTLNALLLFAALELLAGTTLKLRSSVSNRDQQLVGDGRPRETLSYYSSQDWGQTYWHEHRLSGTQRFYPYVGWRRAPFKGKTIVIDENGLRSTPGADCRAESFKVFTFGESSMWGTGSPDWGTIPAHVQKGLEKIIHGPVCVMNFAEAAYVSTQDVIMLSLQLRSGNIPDVVLFYSLSSDIVAAYQSGRTGVPMNLDDIAARFERRTPTPTFVDLIRSTSSYSLAGQLISKLTIADSQGNKPGVGERAVHESPRLEDRSRMGGDSARLADGVAQDYLANYQIVMALARQYGFKYFFFLQPTLTLGNKPLALEEQQMKRAMETNAEANDLFLYVYQALETKSSAYPNIHSMVHVFDRYDSLLWIDAGHVTPVGNELVARRIVEIIARDAIR